MTDPYDELGVARDATHEDIRKAFRKKAKTAHPDNGGSAEDFERAKHASMVLLDPKKRRKFDQHGTIDENQPDNDAAQAMEMVANFFVSSINATVDPGFGIPSLDEVDLVKGAATLFNQQIAEGQQRITRTNRQIKQFEKAITRIKTKRANDVLTTMLKAYVSDLSRTITQNEDRIRIIEMAKAIIKDYEFVQAQTPPQAGAGFAGLLNPYQNHWR